MIWALVDLRGKFNYTTIQAVNKAVGFCQLPQLSSLFFFTNSSHATKLYTEENENQENLVFLFSFLEAAHDERTKSRDFVYVLEYMCRDIFEIVGETYLEGS